uniref:Uncharacterized protein n=1 Tax=Panagrolaimus sp. JU765 TaxID=591449 RepID=A0AC34QR34_9BILA
MPADVYDGCKCSGKKDKQPLIKNGGNHKCSKNYGSVVEVDKNSDDFVEIIPESSVKYGLFGYSEGFDYFLIFLGTAASIIHGAGFPLLSIFLGGMTTVFLRAQNSDWVLGHPANNSDVKPISQTEFNDLVAVYSVYYLILGVVMFITSYVQIACWESVAERMVNKLRNNYLLSILRQEIAWFDTRQTGNLTSRLTDDLERVREGLGDKLSLFIQMLSAFFAGFVVGFIYNWQMSLVMLCFTPLLAWTNAWMARITAQRTAIEQTKYAAAGAVAEETLSSMRTVHSLNAERQEINRYERALEDGRKTGLVKYLYMAYGFAAGHITMYVSYAVAFFFGSRLIIWDPNFDRGSVFTVFFAVMSGSTALGGALPHLSSISMATGAARLVLSVINNKPKIDPYSQNGIIPSRVKGSIEVNNVHFRYPLRSDVKILDGISLKIRPGESIALVGSSGCGKSTIINLLLRFYDPENGFIKLDGHDLRELNVKALRDSIGVVSQEPILFDGTLEENVLLGNEFGSREDVIRCLKMANAYDFITKLNDGLYTRVGIFHGMVQAQQIQTVEDESMAAITEEAVDENEEVLKAGESASISGSKSSLTFKKSVVSGARLRRITTTDQSIVSAVSDAQEIREMQDEIEKNAVKPTPISKIFKMNRGNYHYVVVGLIGCIVSGLVTPAFSLVYAQIFAVFSEPIQKMTTDAIFWSLMFVVLGLATSSGFFVSANALGRCGEALTKELRLQAFTNLMRQDIGFFDDERHNTGKLCTRFATDAPNVRYVFTRLPVVISSVVTLIGSIVIGFVYGWQLALILLAIIPLILASGYFEMQMRFGKAMRDTESLEDAGKIASEAVENIRTIQGLNKQLIFHEKYVQHLAEPFRQNLRQAHIYAAVFAFSQSVMFFMYAISFYLGSIFVNEHTMDPLAVYRVFFAMAFCGQSVGQIIDGVNIRDLNIHSLREQICIVSQEPILFDCTIEENIVYGLDRQVDHDEVVKVAEQANIHKFILGLPEGYQTRVGEKGTQLSGGQKQRIAIARALIRRPSVLLLDEATSALDTESEKIVQDALEKARKGRTCFVIAHRLSTIQNSDKIIVLNEGRVAEFGTHEQLYRHGGIYRALCDTQLLKDDNSES